MQDDHTTKDFENWTESKPYMSEAHQKGHEPRFYDGTVKIKCRNGEVKEVPMSYIYEYNKLKKLNPKKDLQERRKKFKENEENPTRNNDNKTGEPLRLTEETNPIVIPEEATEEKKSEETTQTRKQFEQKKNPKRTKQKNIGKIWNNKQKPLNTQDNIENNDDLEGEEDESDSDMLMQTKEPTMPIVNTGTIDQQQKPKEPINPLLNDSDLLLSAKELKKVDEIKEPKDNPKHFKKSQRSTKTIASTSSPNPLNLSMGSNVSLEWDSYVNTAKEIREELNKTRQETREFLEKSKAKLAEHKAKANIN